MLNHLGTSQQVDINEFCHANGDKLGLARCCYGKGLQTKFWSYKWSYIRQHLLSQNFWHWQCISKAVATLPPLRVSFQKTSLPCLYLEKAGYLCVCIMLHVREKGYNQTKMWIFSTRSETVFQVILHFLFMLYADRESGRTSSSHLTWRNVHPKVLFRFLLCLRLNIQKLSLSLYMCLAWGSLMIFSVCLQIYLKPLHLLLH